MNENQGYTTLDAVVREACLEFDDTRLTYYEKFLMWGIEALEEIRMDLVQEVKTVPATVSQIDTVPFPADYVNWVKLGTLEGDRIKTFVINEDLTAYRNTNDCGEPVGNEPYQADYSVGNDYYAAYMPGYWFFNYYNNGLLSGSLYGYGNGRASEGNFKVDKANRRFIFTPELRGQTILIEYITNGVDPSGASMVDEISKKAVKWYIIWRHRDMHRKYHNYEVQGAKQNYYNELRMVARRNLDITPEKILAITREAYKQSPKN